MNIRGLFQPIIYYAAIDPGGAGGGAPGATPPGTTPPTAQPGGQGGGQGGFREQFFPNVPEEVWGQVEPHVRGVQGHVTQLEQRYAPFKGYRDQDLQGLAEFSTAFERDPVGQWIRMAQGLQQATGPNGQPLLNPDLDVEHLAALATGQLGQDEPQGGPQVQDNGNGDMPPWAQELMQRIDQLEGGVNQFTSSHRQQVEDAVLKRQVDSMKEQLVKAGYPEEALSQEGLLSTYIAHRGNVNAAVQSMVQMRMALLKGFTTPNGEPVPSGGDDNDLTLPNGAPTARPSRKAGRRSSVIKPDVRAGALQYLKKQE